MGLQSKRVPNVADRRVTEPDGFRHLARTPVRRAARRRFQRTDNHLLHLLVGNRALRARSRLIVETIQSMRDKPTAPFADRARRDMQPSRDHLAVRAFGTRQDDARAARERRCRSRLMRHRVQSSPFVFGQDQRYLGASRSHAHLLVEQYERAAPFVSVSTLTRH